MKRQALRVDWECSKNFKQTLFLSCPADELLYGGQAGGAKTESLVIGATGNAESGFFNKPRWRALILRRTFPELEKSAILRSHDLLTGKAKYDGVKHRWVSPCGGIIDFGHIQGEDDKSKYKSSQYNWIGFDELTEFTESMYLYLFSRLRTPDPTIKCLMRAGSNPTGIGHGWVKKRFIDGKEPMKIYEYVSKVPDGLGGFVDQTMTRCFIPSSVFDNKYLMESDPQYVARLNELPDIERRALLYGDWDIESGQFFSEFSRSHICEPFDFPLWWPVWVAMDWGMATKCAIGFYTQDPDSERVYMWNEIYVTGMRVDEVASLIKLKLGKRLISLVGRYADRRISVKDEELQISTRQKFAQHGLHFTLSTDDRVQGWHAVRELLMRDKEGRVKFQVFSTCKEFIRVIPDQTHDINKPEDMNKRGETHHADQFRYFSIMRKSADIDVSVDVHYNASSRTGYVCEPGGLEVPSVLRRLKLTAGVNYFYDKPGMEDEAA